MKKTHLCFIILAYAIMGLNACSVENISGYRHQQGSVRPDLNASSVDNILTPQEIETKIVEFLVMGNQIAAESLLDKHLPVYPRNQRLLFLQGCLIRSRFMINKASFPLNAVSESDKDTVEAKCSQLVLLLDLKYDIEENMKKLEQLVDEHPEKIFVRWMLAVQCRNHHFNELGAKHYKTITEIWKPGPVLIHQTYANILDELNRYEEALIHRKIAVEMEPKAWSYQGLGHTLSELERYEEADNAFIQSVNLGKKGQYYSTWANSYFNRKDYNNALDKSRKAIELDRYNNLGRQILITSLMNLKQYEESLDECQKYLELFPKDEFYKKRLEELKLIVEEITKNANIRRDLGRRFNNQYNGLRPGYSTIDEVFSLQGAPTEIKNTRNGKNYIFKDITVNFSGRDKEHINTIIIRSDYNYICPNGIKLKEDIKTAKIKLKQYRERHNCLYDFLNGIFYWHNGNNITKIVLAYEAKK